MKFPILEPFEYEHLSDISNELLEKYPNVEFDIKDIERYNYITNERTEFIFNKFIEQYKLTNIKLPHHIYYGKIQVTNPYLKEIQYVSSHNKGNHYVIVNFEHAVSVSNEEIQLTKENDISIYFKIDIIDNCFDISYGSYYSHNHSGTNLAINVPIPSIEERLNLFLENKNISENSIIYKYKNGASYFVDYFTMTKHIYHNNYNGNKSTEFSLNSVANINDRYNIPYTDWRYLEYKTIKLPKNIQQITYEQFKVELLSLCNFFTDNEEFLELFNDEYTHETDVTEFLNKHKLNIALNFYPQNKRSDYRTTVLNVKPEKTKSIYIPTANIIKKDKFLGHFDNFNDLDKALYDDLLNELTKIDKNVDLDILDKGIEYLCREFGLEYMENESMSSDYFYYTETFKLGKYKITINSSRYIKDQSICELEINNFELYVK